MRETIIQPRFKSSESNFPLGVLRELKKGRFVYKQNDKTFKFYKLKKGILMMGVSSPNGKDSFTHFVHEGEFFGEEMLLDIQMRKNFAQALSNEVVVEEYSVNKLIEGVGTELVIRDNFVNHFRRIQDTIQRNSNLNLREKLVAILREIGKGIGIKLINGEVLIRTHLKHRELAFLCNATRQSITTQLIALNQDNYINIDRNSILLNNQLLTND